MFDINLPVAFGAGIISFFAPCVLPLLPAYVGYVTGVSMQDLKKSGYTPFRRKLVLSSLFYILGFSLVFVILGTTTASFGFALRKYDFLIQRIGGFVILVLGLQFAGVLKIPLLAKQFKFQLPKWIDKLGYGRSFFVGVVFATAWTPCVGAVLGSILALAAINGMAVQGAILLLVYSLGISIPFLIVSLSLASAPRYLGFIKKYIGPISTVAGVILAILGLLLLTDTYKYFNEYLFQLGLRNGFGGIEHPQCLTIG